MRALLEQAQEVGGIDLGFRSPRVRIGHREARQRRMAGMQALIAAYMQIRPSARTFALAVHIWDKLLVRTIEVVPSSAPSPGHVGNGSDQTGGDGGHHSCARPADSDTKAHHEAAVASTMYDSMLESEDKLRSSHALEASSAATDRLETPLACFVIACKSVETFSPRLVDVACICDGECSAQQIRDAENQVLAELSFDINDITAVDLVHRLLGFASPDRAAQLRHKAEKLLMIAYGRSSVGVSYRRIGDLAVGCLIKICSMPEFGDDIHEFVPSFMITRGARECKEDLDQYLSTRVAIAYNGRVSEEHAAQAEPGV